jgi:hypothetical protein
MKPLIRIFTLIFILTLLISACNVPKAMTDEEKQQTVQAVAQQTIAAMETQAASQPSATPQPPTSTITPNPITNTPPPSTLTPSITPSPTSSVLCNHAKFITDVTVPDDEIFAPNTTFTKTWRLKNIGSCTWTSSYAIVFDSGNSMGYTSPVFLPGSVAPNGVVDLSMDLKSPNTTGPYTGNFKLRDGSGILFGLSATANQPFWVKINVAAPGTFKVFDFIARACDASWSSAAGSLPCPGSEGDTTGFVLVRATPKWETGATDDEAGLETHPQWVDDGTIGGKYPAIKIKTGDRFKAVIGCLYGAASCNVKFFFNYSIAGGSESNFSSWEQSYDGVLTSIDIDLTPLAGNDVNFILRVSANGSSGQDWALWLQPRIMR